MSFVAVIGQPRSRCTGMLCKHMLLTLLNQSQWESENARSRLSQVHIQERLRRSSGRNRSERLAGFDVIGAHMKALRVSKRRFATCDAYTGRSPPTKTLRRTIRPMNDRRFATGRSAGPQVPDWAYEPTSSGSRAEAKTVRSAKRKRSPAAKMWRFTLRVRARL